jgi:hypothetical protein
MTSSWVLDLVGGDLVFDENTTSHQLQTCVFHLTINSMVRQPCDNVELVALT